MTPRALVVSGLALALVALALVVASNLARGPLNPECNFGCSPPARVLLWAALPVALVAVGVIGLGLARRDDPQARLVWGAEGLERHLHWAEVVVIVDVLSFSTAVDVAVSRGASVVPCRWDDADAKRRAEAEGAMWALPRGEAQGGPSLSPASLAGLASGTRVFLPSPNGATLSTLVGDRVAFAACLRNGAAVARAARRSGSRVLVVAAGEHAPGGGWRRAEEDAWGAAAVLRALDASLDPDAHDAVVAFARVEPRLLDALRATSTGQELVGKGFPEDVDVAAAIDVSRHAPRLVGGAYVAENVEEADPPSRPR